MDAEIAALWQAVAADRDDLAPRLILGDAWLDRGNSRGELVHLQCDGHPTLRATRSDGAETVFADASDRTVALASRGHELAADRFADWLPELLPILRRDRCWFHEGMLHGIRPTGDLASWRELAGHPELAMVRVVRGAATADLDYELANADRLGFATYAAAIDALPNAPEWIDLDSVHDVEALVRLRPVWPIRGLRLGDAFAYELASTFPAVTAIELKPPGGYALAHVTEFEHAAIVDRVVTARVAFPRLQSIAFTGDWLQLRLGDGDRALVDDLRRHGVTI